MDLDLTSLDKAVAALEASLELVDRSAFADGSPERALLRDGAIQRFEFTYELCHKMLKRYLDAASPEPGFSDRLVFQDLIRVGCEMGLLLHGWPAWKGYREARATTSHTYDQDKALKVWERIPAFLEEARFLLSQLRQRVARR
jgi:nucleotidyltransferase substrate binding protein (TIGR01987 family)